VNLIVDIGNTRVKAGLFEQGKLEHFFVFDNSNLSGATIKELINEKIFEIFSIENCIVASVVDPIDAFADYLKQKAATLIFTGQTSTPLENMYASAGTLGSDRLAAAVGGYSLFPGQNTLIIDAGTCIKYNFVTHDNKYIGGAISPGLKMRFKALHTFTSRLPLVETDENFTNFIGTNTNESILSGVETGSVAEIQGFIDRYVSLYPDIHIILTGGDANFFEKRLKKPIFADPFIIMKGLNTILEYNLSSK
jgi:type III pantothenate kinase